MVLNWALNCRAIAMLFVFCYLLVQVESGELASTELSAALTENAKLRDENKRLKVACPASNAVIPSQAAASTEIAETGGVNGARQRVNLELGEEETAASTAAITAADVKCSGNAQDQAQLKGTLDCESNPSDLAPGKAKNKGSKCLDNLSSGKYYQSRGNGEGICATFTASWLGSTTKDRTSNQPRSGLVTKAFVAHPDKASETVGAFGFKRVLCKKNGGQCANFKNAVCIKCPAKIFATVYEGDATWEEKTVFMNCCVLGKKQYQVGSRRRAKMPKKDCPANMIGTGAFTAPNDAAAELKKKYQCSDEDNDKAMTLVASA